MPFNVNSITPRQKLIIAKGLLDYDFIMNNWRQNTPDFQDVYYEFYLKARWAIMKKQNIRNAYFNLLYNNSTNDLMSIIDTFQQSCNSHEFSICSKLLHTANPSFPIYDSKVRIFLIRDQGLNLLYNTGKSSDLSRRDQIVHDWNLICEWYNIFLTSTEGISWINWFNREFPDYQNISDVKKIDSIIFATN